MIIVSCKPDAPSKSSEGTDASTPVENAVNNKGKKTGAQNGTGQSSTLRTKDEKSKATDNSGTNFNSEGIPDACDLLTSKTIGRYVRQPAETIFSADGSSPQNKKARACFFKWDGSDLANAGVMVQLQRNPVQEDVPEYFTYLIASKKTEGEKDPATDHTIKYQDWPGFGDDGAYSTEAGKYVWRVGNDWAFMIAFNTVLPPKAQKVAADAFAREVMANMTF